MIEQPTVALGDGNRIPQVGLGVWQTPDDLTALAVSAALASGYRHVDTASVYGNERGVGEGIRVSGVPRGDVFVTTKIWNDDHGFDAAMRAAETSLRLLGLEHVDLYLVHWPVTARGLTVETWKAMIRLREEGRARSIGVSNFTAGHLDLWIAETGVAPAINQIELHPGFQQRALRRACAVRGVATESWSPLGQGRTLAEPAVLGLAEKHRRTPAQVIIRWHLQSGLVAIPKSSSPVRIAENLDVFGFVLDDGDMAAMEALDRPDGRIGRDPDEVTS